MSEIIIHAGTHKTGSTTIQDTLFYNRRLLRQRGVVYPRVGQIAPHHNLVTEWVDLPPQYRARRSARENWATLARAWGGGEQTVLVSSEEFSRLQPAVDFRSLRAFTDAFDRRRLACVFRSQLGYIQSIYLQVTKGQAFVDFDYFVRQCLVLGYATGLPLDYNLLLDRMLAGFAPDELVPLSYEASVRGEGGLLGAFCRKLALPVAAEELAPLPGGHSNVSPAPLALWLANQRAAPGVATAQEVARAGQVVADALGEGVRTTLFTRAQVGRIRRHFREANRRFAARCRAIDPEFTFEPLRLPEDIVHRDEAGTDMLLRMLDGTSVPAAAPPAPPASAPPASAPAVPPPARRSFEELRTRPTPLLIRDAGIVVAWSPKSACSHVALWTFLHEGLYEAATAYHVWPHEYRMRVYYKSREFRRAAHAVAETGGRGHTLLKITRDPRKRLVSMFRHAVRFPFLAGPFRRELGLDIAARGVSLRDFGALLRRLPLVPPTPSDPHVCAQYHPAWDWDWDRVVTLNIDQFTMNDGLNAVEDAFGLARTDFAGRAAFDDLRKLHYSVPARLETDGPIEDHRFEAGRVKRFPGNQLLRSPLVASLAEELYAVDMGAATDLGDSAGLLFRPAAASAPPQEAGLVRAT